jgi:hypothetical protein
MTDRADLVVGAFYWVLPVFDPDTDLDWQNEVQPASRLAGRSDDGSLLWDCIGLDEPSDWTMRWIGERIVSPSR